MKMTPGLDLTTWLNFEISLSPNGTSAGIVALPSLEGGVHFHLN